MPVCSKDPRLPLTVEMRRGSGWGGGGGGSGVREIGAISGGRPT